MTTASKSGLWIWLLAGIALAVSLNTWLSAPRHLARLRARANDLQHIQRIAARWDAEMAYQQELKDAGRTTPPDLQEMAKRAFENDNARIQLRPASAAAEGWQLREAQVELEDVPYAHVGIFLDYAGGFRPGWRLRELVLRPSAQSGRGGATLVLEAITSESAKP